jgi:hypothetical protein
VAVNPSAGTLTESVDLGNPLDCSDAAHGGYTGFDPNWYGFSITGSSDKGLKYQVNNTTDTPRICFGATADFPTNTGDIAAPGTLPDGTPGFIGLLPNCASAPAGDPCIVSIVPTVNGAGSVVQIDVPQAFAGDPFTHM